MGTVAIHAGVIRRDHEYLGGVTAIPAQIFLVDQMRSMRHGFLIPASDTGLGTPSNAMEFAQTNIGGTGKVATEFYYDVNNAQRVRYAISCNSADIATALESTSNQHYYAAVVATGSGYTLKG